MTRDDIIRMARECFADPDGSLTLLTPELTAFAQLVAAAEREACAQVVNDDRELSDDDAIRVCRAIRARGQQ